MKLYLENAYFFTLLIPTFSLLLQNVIPTFPYFFVEGHMTACEGMAKRGCWRPYFKSYYK